MLKLSKLIIQSKNYQPTPEFEMNEFLIEEKSEDEEEGTRLELKQ